MVKRCTICNREIMPGKEIYVGFDGRFAEYECGRASCSRIKKAWQKQSALLTSSQKRARRYAEKVSA